MILLLAEGGQHLLQAEDFKRFSLHCGQARPERPPEPVEGVTFETAEVAWVAVDRLIALRGASASPEWLSALDAMIAKAEPYGWVSKDRRQVRAHVEWSSPQRPEA